MDTKWKNNRKPILFVVAVTAAASILFMSLFPYFSKKAEAHYEDPFTSKEFINELYRSNFIQYRYLREKVDQRQYSYSDLYFHYERTDNRSENITEDAQNELNHRIWEISSAIDTICGAWEEDQSETNSMIDYYLEDTISGTILSNSGHSLPDAVAQDGDSSNYVYYINMEYDSAGNIGNVSVKCRDDARGFLSNVQSAGHNNLFYIDKTSMGMSQASSLGFENMLSFEEGIYDSTSEASDDDNVLVYMYRYSVKNPTSVRIIYGLTQEQYNVINTLNSSSTVYDSGIWNARYYSYNFAGIPIIFILFIGFFCLSGVLLCRRFIRRSVGEPPFVCQIPVELSFVVLGGFVAVSDSMVSLVYQYQNGLFLRNIKAGIGIGGYLKAAGLDRVAMFLFLFVLFLLAFMVGCTFAGITRRNFRQHSILCRYWNRIVSKIKGICKKLYDELIGFDIGRDANQLILKIVIVNFLILLVICSFWLAGMFGLIVYSVLIYFLLKKYVKDIQDKYRKLLKATSSIAQGNLDTALSENFGVFESYKSQLRQIQVDFKRAVDDEVKSQRMKSELITNVSHDLKTPLTAIITYIDLLKEPGLTDEKRAEYLQIVEKKSNRLKVLIEDLFEVSKANSKAVTLQVVNVDICNLMRQAFLEQDDRVADAGLIFKFIMPQERIILPLDSQKTYRIFENLYTNIIKYALPNTRVYITLKEEPESVSIELKNISANELQIDPNELSERFVRGDGSRNTEGSGLGLAIARSFTELQGGSMEIQIDGDLFKVILQFQKGPAPEPVMPPGPNMPPFIPPSSPMPPFNPTDFQ